MAKGICCQLQAEGHLGQPIQLTIHKKDGTTTQRCGVCEVRPSCSNPQKLVFAFRFLKSAICGIAGVSSCKPTAAGTAQYSAARQAAATTGASFEVEDPFTGMGVPAPASYRVLPIPGA